VRFHTDLLAYVLLAPAPQMSPPHGGAVVIVAMKIARNHVGPWLVLAVIWLDGGASAAYAEPEPTLWSHNGSVLYLVAKGNVREFYYKQPRPGMIQAGAYPGALLFRGRSISHQYSGTAFVFDSRCGQLPYQVDGPILDNYERKVLRGLA